MKDLDEASFFAFVKTANLNDDYWRFHWLVPEINEPLPTGIIYAHDPWQSRPARLCTELSFVVEHYTEVKKINRGISFLLGLENPK